MEKTLGKLEGEPQGSNGVNMEMPFGKHEGEEIADLPIPYVKWCLENLDLDGWLEEELEDVVSWGGTDYRQ